jgi:hypothetical protein
MTLEIARYNLAVALEDAESLRSQGRRSQAMAALRVVRECRIVIKQYENLHKRKEVCNGIKT